MSVVKTVIDNAAVDGITLSTASNITLRAAIAYCNATPGCKGFNFAHNNNFDLHAITFPTVWYLSAEPALPLTTAAARTPGRAYVDSRYRLYMK